VLAGLTRIASCDIRKAVRWNSAEVEDEVDGEDSEGGPSRIVVRAENSVLLVNSEELDDDTAACISEVQQTKDGLRIKFHSKLDALDKLARAHGIYKDTVNHKHEITLADLIAQSYITHPQKDRRSNQQVTVEAPTIEATAIETAPAPVKVEQE
jgi:hypothetical protein